MPYLYDWLANHNLVWPTQCCRWGPPLGPAGDCKQAHRVYVSEQTDGSEPNKLVVARADIVRPRVAAAESIASFREVDGSPFVQPLKTILHPGEVNKIRELPAYSDRLLATHTDAPDVFLWDVEAQPAYTKGSWAEPTPDLVLKGHTDIAPFALGASCAPGSGRLASGGRDALVVVWDAGDLASSLAGRAAGGAGVGAGAGAGAAGGGQTLEARYKLSGHDAQVEDVVFKPGCDHELASVGDDRALLFWDTRARGGDKPTVSVPGAHGDDVQCLDWAASDPHLVVTGSADSSVHVWDTRKLGGAGAGALHEFQGHRGSVLRVQWHTLQPGVFASGGEDALLNVWDLGGAAGASASSRIQEYHGAPPGLLFQHCGHRDNIVDFQWNQSDPWTLLSVSDDTSAGGGGALQMWRINDLIYRPQAEVLAELEQYKDFILTGKD